MSAQEKEGKQKYIQDLKFYHKGLEIFLKNNYGIKTEYLEVMSWGYVSTALYIKTTEGKEIVARIGEYSKEKIKNIERDYNVTKYLSQKVPTSEYILDKNGRYLISYEDNEVLRLAEKPDLLIKSKKRVIRLSDYIQGTPPFDMNLKIFTQAVEILKIIHQQEIPTYINLEKSKYKNGNEKLLHGDLTPSNILVSFGNVAAVVDFEESCIGPVEWDLARCAFFGWGRMKNVEYKKVIETLYVTYKEKTLDIKSLIEFSIENAYLHLNNVMKHKERYETYEKWKEDFDISKRQVDELEKSKGKLY